MPTHEPIVSQQDWARAAAEFANSAPFNYTVLDNFLTPDACELVRGKILANREWSYMNWKAQELFIRNFDLPEVESIASHLKSSLPSILGDMALMQHIAFLHQRNAGLCPHSDTGAITVDLWLTPDECNIEPDTGGLLLYDVKRTETMKIHEFNAAPYSVEFLERETKGGIAKIPYRYNRAIIFDARTFHSSDRMNFSTGAHRARINFALLFDDPDVFSKRYGVYGSNRGIERQLRIADR